MKKDSKGNIYMEQDEYQKYLTLKEKPLEVWQMSTEKDNKPQEEETTTAETASPTLYELNQQIIEKMPILNETELNKCTSKIFKYLNKNPDRYYMLLCNELNYYTLFHITGNSSSRGAIRDLTDEILDIISHLGNVRVIEEDNNGAIAVWSSFNTDETVHCFYLFPYGKGVVEV